MSEVKHRSLPAARWKRAAALFSVAFPGLIGFPSCGSNASGPAGSGGTTRPADAAISTGGSSSTGNTGGMSGSTGGSTGNTGNTGGVSGSTGGRTGVLGSGGGVGTDGGAGGTGGGGPEDAGRSDSSGGGAGGSSACDPAATGPFLEKDGVVVVEFESVAAPSPMWAKKTDHAGFTGSGYYEWTGPDAIGTPSASCPKLAYDIKLASAGTYQFFFRTHWNLDATGNHHITDPNGNDTWLRFVGGSDVGSEGPFDDAFHKVMLHGRPTTFSFSTSADDGGDHVVKPVVQQISAPGVLRIEICPRQKGHGLDRFVLVKYNGMARAALTEDEQAKYATAPSSCRERQ